jgi:ATP-dependent 26S proteasome regulatory subunit
MEQSMISQAHSNNGMDMIKNQLMTMVMFKSMNNTGNSSNSSGIFDMIYIFIATQLVDTITKSLPFITKAVSSFFSKKSDKLFNEIIVKNSSTKSLSKSASITIDINISDADNIYGHSLLDHITNHANTKHVSYKNKNFILNQNDIIEVSDEIFVTLKEQKNNLQNQENTDRPTQISQIVEIFSYTKTIKDLRTFLDKISNLYQANLKNKLGNGLYYFNLVPQNARIVPNNDPLNKNNPQIKDYSNLPPTCVFTMKPFSTNRNFNNLFGEQIETIRTRVEFFMNNKKWYQERGIAHTLGILLSGQSGAGKTSVLKCLSNTMHRHIININFNNDITKLQLENLFYNDTLVVMNSTTGVLDRITINAENRIFVIEDIDAQGDLVLERSLKPSLLNLSQQGRESLDLSFLLNIMDGILEIDNRVLVMTSNFPEKIDHALLRGGRIDVNANFKNCTNKTIIEMIEFYYSIKLTDEDKNNINMLEEHIISPANMGRLMFENFENYTNVVNILKNKKFTN